MCQLKLCAEKKYEIEPVKSAAISIILYFYLNNTCPNLLKKAAMGKSKKNLDDLKKDLKTIKKDDMNKIVGGKDKKNTKKWNNGCGGIVPQ
jgi:hypothetical protein